MIIYDIMVALDLLYQGGYMECHNATIAVRVKKCVMPTLIKQAHAIITNTYRVRKNLGQELFFS